jgi:hypothetical protein
MLGYFRRTLLAARQCDQPFRHWLLDDALPPFLADALAALPFVPPQIADTEGRRETNNATRRFITPAERDAFPACAALADLLQDSATTGLITSACGRSLAGLYLRIEYCQDTDGFWLEPHTDIAAKRYTMLIYLSKHPDAPEWGTDLYDVDRQPAGCSPGRFNKGLIFLPASDTWHGFARRHIAGVRRSIIVNYVSPDWRSRHELAFPAAPIRDG